MSGPFLTGKSIVEGGQNAPVCTFGLMVKKQSFDSYKSSPTVGRLCNGYDQRSDDNNFW